jgi:ribose transport system permease protein
MNAALASVLAVIICAGVGVLNGFVVVVGVDGFIVTLVSSTLLLGGALAISHSTTVYGLSRNLGNIALTNVLGLHLTFYYGVAIVLLLAYIVCPSRYWAGV